MQGQGRAPRAGALVHMHAPTMSSGELSREAIKLRTNRRTLKTIVNRILSRNYRFGHVNNFDATRSVQL